MITILVKCDTAEKCWKELNTLRRLLARQNIVYDDYHKLSDTRLEIDGKILIEYVCDKKQYVGRLVDLTIGFDLYESSSMTRRSNIAMVAAYEHPYPYVLKLLHHTDSMALLSFCTIYNLSLEFRTEELLTTTIICRLNSGDYKYAIRLTDDDFNMFINNELYTDAIINKLYRGIVF